MRLRSRWKTPPSPWELSPGSTAKQPLTGLLAAVIDVFQLDRLLARLRLIVQDHGGDRVVLECLSKDRPAGHRTRRVFVTATQFDNDLGPLEHEVGDGGELAGRRRRGRGGGFSINSLMA